MTDSDNRRGAVLSVAANRIGLIADIHCSNEDGSDMPAEALDALRGVDLILDLGHTGGPESACLGVLDRLATVAPVLSVRHFYGGDAAPVLSPSDGQRIDGVARVINAGGVRIGAVHNLERGPGPKITTASGGLPELDSGAHDAMSERFGTPVDIVAFGGTHRAATALAGGVLFVNPGSPTYPRGPGRIVGQRSPGTVGILTVDNGVTSFEVVELALLIASAASAG